MESTGRNAHLFVFQRIQHSFVSWTLALMPFDLCLECIHIYIYVFVAPNPSTVSGGFPWLTVTILRHGDVSQAYSYSITPW